VRTKNLLVLIGSVCLAVMLALPLVAGCAAPTPTPTPTPTPAADPLDEPLVPMALSFGSGGLGGTYYPYEGGVAELINKNLPGFRATVEVTGGSVSNVRLVQSGEAQLGGTQTDVAKEAYEGIGRFEGEKLGSLRGLFSMFPEYAQIVTLESSHIYTIADIVGKRFSTGSPGSGTEVICKYIYTALGYTDDDFVINRLGFSEQVAALKDGTLDVGFWIVGMPTSSIIDLASTHKIRIIPITPEEVAKVNAAYPYYFAGTIPAGTYSGVDVDVPSLFVGSLIAVHEEMQYRLAYEIVKLVYENLDYLRTVHVAANHTTLESGPKVAIPLHPGAERYYKEMGIL